MSTKLKKNYFIFSIIFFIVMLSTMPFNTTFLIGLLTAISYINVFVSLYVIQNK